MSAWYVASHRMLGRAGNRWPVQPDRSRGIEDIPFLQSFAPRVCRLDQLSRPLVDRGPVVDGRRYVRVRNVAILFDDCVGRSCAARGPALGRTQPCSAGIGFGRSWLVVLPRWREAPNFWVLCQNSQWRQVPEEGLVYLGGEAPGRPARCESWQGQGNRPRFQSNSVLG